MEMAESVNGDDYIEGSFVPVAVSRDPEQHVADLLGDFVGAAVDR